MFGFLVLRPHSHPLTLQVFWELPFPPNGWQPGPRVTSHPQGGPSQNDLEEWALLCPGC